MKSSRYAFRSPKTPANPRCGHAIVSIHGDHHGARRHGLPSAGSLPQPQRSCSHSRRWCCRALLLACVAPCPLAAPERKVLQAAAPHCYAARSSSPCVPPFCTSTQHFGRKVQVAGTSQTRWRTGERTDEDRREKTTGR
jgi:hypothetical protein